MLNHTAMSPAAEHLFGLFRAVHDEALPRTSLGDLYEGENTLLYEEHVTPTVADLPGFIRLARRTRGPVLDLACGSGRLTLPLAQRGLPVVGVDLSSDMLALLDDKLASLGRDVGGRIELHLGDMTRLDEVGALSGRRFALVVLGATSIVLAASPEDRRRLFRGVAAVLAPGGRFAFDIILHERDDIERHPERYHVWTRPVSADGTHCLTLVGQRFVSEHGSWREQVNFLTEEIDSSGVTRRRLASTCKAVFFEQDVHADLASSGLRVIQTTPQDGSSHQVLLVCARD